MGENKGMERVYAIILGGGMGHRLGGEVPKQFLPLGGKPVIAWSMELFNSLPGVDRIVVVVPGERKSEAESIAHRSGIDRLYSVLPGGSTRQGSARNALDLLHYSGDDILMFHDAARPFISASIASRCLDDARAHGAAAVYVPLRDTLAVIKDGYVRSVPARDTLYHAQTPQAFRHSIIRAAHDTSLPDDTSITDDVSLALAAGFKVKMTEGDYCNIKITDESDYRTACRRADDILANKEMS